MSQPVFDELDEEPIDTDRNTLKPLSKKTIGATSGAAIGSIVPGIGSFLGAIIGYSVADSAWIANKMDTIIEKYNS